MGLRIPLYELRVTLGAKMIDFGGQGMPLYYGSQAEEHHQVRRDYGVFDMLHMTVVDISDGQAIVYSQHLLANGMARLSGAGKAFYSAMLSEEGRVVDNLIIYLTEGGYRVVVNVPTRSEDITWMQIQAAGFKVDLQERGDLAMLAIQGHNAHVRNSELVSPAHAALMREPEPFQGHAEGDWFITHIDYTSEDSLKTMLPTAEVPGFLNKLAGAGISPAGLGVCDTLCLEAGLNLYGQDMDENVPPFVADMDWIIVWKPVTRDFVGCRAPKTQKAVGDQPKLVGLVLEERGVLYAHQVVWVADADEEEIISGDFSSTLNKSIVPACVPATTGNRAEVEIRGKRYLVRVVRLSFVRHDKPPI